MDTTAQALADKMLRRHEGIRLKPYLCTAGKQTIGVGRNLTDRGISEEEAELLLANDIDETTLFLSTEPYWSALCSYRKAALIDLCFCVGPAGYLAFKKLRAALEAGRHEEASAQILDSKFARQTGTRATELARIMRHGF